MFSAGAVSVIEYQVELNYPGPCTREKGGGAWGCGKNGYDEEFEMTARE